MKIYIIPVLAGLFLCFAVFFCTPIHKIVYKTKKEEYNEKFMAYDDSFNIYYDKSLCYTLCGKSDSAKIINKKWYAMSDSETVYYNLMYPQGNPVTKEEKPKCDCK